jgi:hypothetical protein
VYTPDRDTKIPTCLRYYIWIWWEQLTLHSNYVLCLVSLNVAIQLTAHSVDDKKVKSLSTVDSVDRNSYWLAKRVLSCVYLCCVCVCVYTYVCLILMFCVRFTDCWWTDTAYTLFYDSEWKPLFVCPITRQTQNEWETRKAKERWVCWKVKWAGPTSVSEYKLIVHSPWLLSIFLRQSVHLSCVLVVVVIW